MPSSESLPHFTEAFLAYLHEVRPVAAFFDGVHTHDDLLDDYSRGAIDAHARELSSWARRLHAIALEGLSAEEQVEHRVLEASIRSRLYELEEVRNWERNPQFYADLLATALAGQALFQHAPAEERARRMVSKLRQAPHLVAAARANVKEPAGILVKAAVETLRGVHQFIERDLPRAFATVDDLSVLGDLADASTEAAAAVAAYADELEKEIGPKAKGTFRLGPERFRRKLELDEGITIEPDRLLAIGLRELHATQEAFREVAAKLGGGDVQEGWRKAREEHPVPGSLVEAARGQVDELADYIRRRGLVTVPDGGTLVVAPTPPFYRWTFASLWAPGPFEPRPDRAFYYLTDAEPGWPADRQAAHLRDFNRGALWSITIHEAYPGHFLHAQHLRRVKGPLRKSQLFAPMSTVEGWAHYCEQMMVEEGFGKKDPHVRLGQLAEALIRLARLIVGIRLHVEDLSVEQGVRFFRDEAYMEEASARREAERGTFDPSYVTYTLGKLMVLKLRADWKAEQGSRYTIRRFHDELLSHGTLPIPAMRRLMLSQPDGAVLE